jgi:hypothetical protein
MRQATPVLTLGQIGVYVIIPGLGLPGVSPLPGPGEVLTSPTPNISSPDPALSLIGEMSYYDSMQRMLQRSGGDLIYNTNGVKEAIQQIAAGAWNYYTLSYTPSNRVIDGKYRHLDVDVPGRPLRLQHRSGYYARTMEAQHNASFSSPANHDWVSLEAATALGGPNVREVLFTAHAEAGRHELRVVANVPGARTFLETKYRNKPFRNYAMTYRVDCRTIGVLPREGGYFRTRLKLVAVVYDTVGHVVSSQSDEVLDDMAARNYQTRQDVVVSQNLAIPSKGNFFLRLGVEDKLTGRLGVLEVPVDQIKVGAGK